MEKIDVDFFELYRPFADKVSSPTIRKKNKKSNSVYLSNNKRKEIKFSVPITNDGSSGCVFTQEVIDNFIKESKEGNILGKIGSGSRMELGEITHKVKNAEVVGENIEIDIEVLDTPMGKKLQDMMYEGYVFVPSIECDGDSIKNIKQINIIKK